MDHARSTAGSRCRSLYVIWGGGGGAATLRRICQNIPFVGGVVRRSLRLCEKATCVRASHLFKILFNLFIYECASHRVSVFSSSFLLLLSVISKCGLTRSRKIARPCLSQSGAASRGRFREEKNALGDALELSQEKQGFTDVVVLPSRISEISRPRGWRRSAYSLLRNPLIFENG